MGGCISRPPIQGQNSFRSQGGLTESSSPRSSDYAGGQVNDSNSLDGRYSTVSDNHSSIEDVTKARTCSGLESSNFIVCLDVTKSNEWTGKCKRNLHQTGDVQTPYEQALPIVQNILVSFDEENIIPGSEAAIMGFPSRSNATSISGGQSGHFPQRDPLPPDHGESSSVTTYVNQNCIMCTDPTDMAFGCGHQACGKCAQGLYSCHICRRHIHTRVKLSRGSDQIWCPLCPTNQCNPKNMAFDCGHQTCSKCGESLQRCPKCHKTIKMKIKLF